MCFYLLSAIRLSVLAKSPCVKLAGCLIKSANLDMQFIKRAHTNPTSLFLSVDWSLFNLLILCITPIYTYSWVKNCIPLLATLYIAVWFWTPQKVKSVTNCISGVSSPRNMVVMPDTARAGDYILAAFSSLLLMNSCPVMVLSIWLSMRASSGACSYDESLK